MFRDECTICGDKGLYYEVVGGLRVVLCLKHINHLHMSLIKTRMFQRAKTLDILITWAKRNAGRRELEDLCKERLEIDKSLCWYVHRWIKTEQELYRALNDKKEKKPLKLSVISTPQRDSDFWNAYQARGDANINLPNSFSVDMVEEGDQTDGDKN